MTVLHDFDHGVGVNSTDVLFFRKVGCDGIGRMDGVVCLCCVSTSVLEDDLATTGVFCS